MKVKIKRFDPSLPLPRYQSPGAACVDLYARLDVTIAPGRVGYVPLNIGLEMGVISPTLFAMMVIMALATTMATTPVLQRLSAGQLQTA